MVDEVAENDMTGVEEKEAYFSSADGEVGQLARPRSRAVVACIR